MKRTLLLTSLLLLAACNTIGGESSREPRGNPDGLVLVEEYADLQCPACRAAHGQISAPLLEQYGDRIRFEYRHFPLRSIHPHALSAAMASECAADQGKFWEYVDHVFENQEDLSKDILSDWAGDIGLNTDAFEQCLNSNSKRGVVLGDYAEGIDLGVTGTPTFFVDGTRVQTGFDTLSEAIDAKLSQYEQRL